jgi:cell division protein FtsQ
VVRANRFLRRLRNVLFVALLLEVVGVALTTPRLAVREVQVLGSRQRTPAEVARIAGLDRPMNILLARAGRAERRIAALPEVSSVDVFRVFPAELRVNIVERVPVASVMTNGGLWVMDGAGVIFRTLKQPLPGLPLLRVRPASSPLLGKALPLPTLGPALETIRGLKDSTLPAGTTLIVDRRNGAILLCPDGLKVRLGPVDRAPKRLSTLNRMLVGKDGTKIRHEAAVIDMATPLGEVMVRRPPAEVPPEGGQD